MLKKAILIIASSLCVLQMLPQYIATYDVCMNCKLDMTNFKLVYTHEATVEMSSPTTSNFLNVPQMRTCWLIKNWSEYSSVVKKAG